MRAVVLLALLTTGCGSVQQGFQKGFDKSFLEKCQTAATGKGATAVRAKTYCECALGKVHDGKSLDEAANLCQ